MPDTNSCLKFVFPGGRIEPLDCLMPSVSELHPDTEKKLLERVADPAGDFARAFALAALRETAEETGLLLGVKRDRPPAVPGEIWAGLRKQMYPDWGKFISSRARSRLRGGRAALIRGF